MRIRVIQTDTEEEKDFELPKSGPEFISHLIAVVPYLNETRLTGFSNVGPAIEIRRIPEDVQEWYPVNSERENE